MKFYKISQQNTRPKKRVTVKPNETCSQPRDLGFPDAKSYGQDRSPLLRASWREYLHQQRTCISHLGLILVPAHMENI